MSINFLTSDNWQSDFFDSKNNHLTNGFLGVAFWQDLSYHTYLDCSKKNKPAMIIHQAIIMLGSNDNAKFNLIKAVQALQNLLKIDNIDFGNYIVSQDYTGRSSDRYHNQVLKVQLASPILWHDLKKTLKYIEQLCGRTIEKKETTNGDLVALDLDILAVADNDTWYKLSKRFPLKQHERLCLGIDNEMNIDKTKQSLG